MRRRGFTLVEVCIVVAVIGLIAAIVITGIVSTRDKRDGSTTRVDGIKVSEFEWKGHQYLMAVYNSPCMLHSESCPCHRPALERVGGGVVIVHSTTNFSYGWITNTNVEAER